jgi:tripartite-type tricarboxylate transporter receptor subunit TctC
MRQIVKIVFWTFILLQVIGANCEAAGIDFPSGNKMITMVVPFPPGGGTDVVGRMIATTMEKVLPTKVIVANKPGGGGTVGTQAVAAAKPDGYTIMFTSQSVVTQTYQTKGAVSHHQFAILGMLNDDVFGLAVARNAPWRTLQDFIKEAKEKPGKLRVGTTGVGSITYMQIPLLEKGAGIKLQAIPYQGSQPQHMAALGGHVEACGAVIGDAIGLLKSGDLRLLGVMSAKRLKEFPDVPTYREMGVDVDFIFWRGLFVHKDTPKPVVSILREATAKVAHSETYKEMVTKAGYTPAALVTEEELQNLIKNEEKIVQEVLKDLGAPGK